MPEVTQVFIFIKILPLNKPSALAFVCTAIQNRLSGIANVPFVVGLSVLLLNDFYLKEQYHNWWTGKLSDVAGLFVFALFWSTLFPRRREVIFFLTALLFAVWKSPYADPFINLCGTYLFSIHRVVDITDLGALLILPLGFWYRPKNTSHVKVNPVLIALITIASFCATSVATPRQTFEPPQYLLFQRDVITVENSDYPARYSVYDLDSLILVRVQEIPIEQHPQLNDDFHKSAITADLDLRWLRASRQAYDITTQLSAFSSLRDSLVVRGKTSVSIALDSVIDVLSFKNSRLEGPFRKYSNDGQVLVHGKYKNGLQDSTWTFYNTHNEVISRKTFVNGELNKTTRYEDSILTSEQTHDTRHDTIIKKYFHLAIILLCIAAITAKLISNYRKDDKPTLQLSHFSKIVMALGLPLIIIVISMFIASYIPNPSSPGFFEMFGKLFFGYVVMTPLFVFIFYLLELKNYIDLIFYILLFSLSIVMIEEYMNLKSLL